MIYIKNLVAFISFIGSAFFLLGAILELISNHSIVGFLFFLIPSIFLFVLFYKISPEPSKNTNNIKTFNDPVELARTKYILPYDIEKDILSGLSYAKCANKLKLRKEFSELKPKELKELVSTAGTKLRNEQSIKSFEDDYDYYEISPCNNACEICKSMSQRKYKIKDRKTGINFPPFHLGCRCSFTIVTPNDFMERYERNHRN